MTSLLPLDLPARTTSSAIELTPREGCAASTAGWRDSWVTGARTFIETYDPTDVGWRDRLKAKALYIEKSLLQAATALALRVSLFRLDKASFTDIPTCAGFTPTAVSYSTATSRRIRSRSTNSADDANRVGVTTSESLPQL